MSLHEEGDWTTDGTSLQRAREALRALIALMVRHGELNWSDKLTDSLTLLNENPEQGVMVLRSLYGGMGSLNDLALLELNGHTISPAEELTANALLQSEVAELWNALAST